MDLALICLDSTGNFYIFRLKGVIWRNYSGIKISHQAKEDFMFLRHLLLQFPVCRWDRGQQRELKMARSAPKWGKQPLHAQRWGDSQSQQAAHTSFWCCCYRSILEKSIKEGWVLHWRSIFRWTFLYSWCTGLGAAFRNLALEKWFSCVLNFGKTVLPGMTEGGVTK